MPELVTFLYLRVARSIELHGPAVYHQLQLRHTVLSCGTKVENGEIPDQARHIDDPERSSP